tara:strand:- start:8476 stop:9282 length:807 start_codon:yes stop_codon:yes gene_type:complete
MTRRRLDLEMVRRDLTPTRSRAKELIDAGEVLVRGAVANKPAHLVAAGDSIALVGAKPRFVSRGGDKLDAALTQFKVDVNGKRVIDVGSSTGGFTDCVIQRGAAQVVAIDVGYGQLDHGLREDIRVKVFERTNVRHLDISQIGGPAPLVVADLSFISLKVVCPRLTSLCEPEGDLLMLVKPQFEAGRVEAARGQGIIRNPKVWRRVIEEVSECFSEAKFGVMGVMVSPLRGASGNTEFFLHCRRGIELSTQFESIDQVVEEAEQVGSP